MLRVMRHAARTGFRIDEDCLDAILDQHTLISDSPPMRVYEEMKKDLTCGHFFTILRLLSSSRLLMHLLPELTGENSSLLADSTFLSSALSRVDESNRNGEGASPTAVLTLLALFTASPRALEVRTAKELADSFSSEQQLLEALDGTFPSLAVPRKERERIAQICRTWYRGHVPGARPLRRAAPEELPLLRRYLDDEEAQLSAGSEEAPESDNGLRGKRRRRRRKPNGAK